MENVLSKDVVRANINNIFQNTIDLVKCLANKGIKDSIVLTLDETKENIVVKLKSQVNNEKYYDLEQVNYDSIKEYFRKNKDDIFYYLKNINELEYFVMMTMFKKKTKLDIVTIENLQKKVYSYHKDDKSYYRKLCNFMLKEFKEKLYEYKKHSIARFTNDNIKYISEIGKLDWYDGCDTVYEYLIDMSNDFGFNLEHS